jgi:sterol desaturase/sphingolipid hydroxylase (fatty acid hydroxylase superfamily)
MRGTELAVFGAIAASAGILILLERRVPYNPGQRLFRPGFWTDLLLYNFFQSYVLGAVIAATLAWMDQRTGLSRRHWIGSWPVPLQLAFFVVTHDFYIYCFHRLQHRSALLWRIHAAHHSVADVDWLSGARSHALEILINQTIEFAPIVLLGAAPEVALWKGAISAIWGMFIHSNLDVRLRGAQRILNGPEMHRWHHSLDAEAFGKNFSTKLAVWDWLFGTAYLPDPACRKAALYGLTEPDYPATYWGQQLQAFRPRAARRPKSSSPAAA